ncbi:3-oxoacyl-[acyl-carrier protein] reductase [Cladophialophora psammophila CBS 110553]|uniref:3-oxoacyl-[acyl-carrier protein] reductase n=1 Tax=Cladophialophora psammophila CBS 110553 TaxID=1182543 RepID=W9XRI1_9EURO|nr:3-oxoacyl-[acyl-carrier protein] reductase [Cladophialophora psammophila CBS 110553]EXJ72889.1 3-oxoacyl-[acyl-carrier protein] reductase [Cladophialophora psammophila CBS 110553]
MSNIAPQKYGLHLLRSGHRGSQRTSPRLVTANEQRRLRFLSYGSSRLGRLDSKRIIITGGAQGIGESIVRKFASEGASITSMDLNDSVGARVAAEATKAGPGKVSYLSVDVSSKESVTKAFVEATQKMGGLDVMVNVAGVQKNALAHDPPLDVLERVTKVNIWGTIFTNATAFTLMKESGKGGAIINFGSEAGLTAERDNSVYGMSKGAVHTWTRSVAREWGLSNVRVNAVLPYVATPMYYRYRDALSPEELKNHEQLLKEFPLGGNLGDPTRDLAPVLVFLASDDSHWMTGQLFPVDGGHVAVR